MPPSRENAAVCFAGIKGFAVCCWTGYCYIQSIDGGFDGDLRLRKHGGCPLGRTARTVMHVLLEACPPFAAKIDGKGVTIAMDNYFTSAGLFLSLASRDIFAVGTLRGKRVGLDGAQQLWRDEGKVIKKRGDMAFARSGELVCIEWQDSKTVNLMTTKHVFEGDWDPREYQ